MKVKCIFDNKLFQQKPVGYETGGIIKRMTIDIAKEYTIEEIKTNILEGKTIRPSYCGGKESEWISQQIFMLDIDNKEKDKYRTYQDIINYCKNINLDPTFIYTSFNHSEECHKIRLVYVLDKPITDINIARDIQLYLMSIIVDTDEQCKNLNRIYYAGKEIVFNSNNIINSEDIIKKSSNINDLEKCPPNNNNIYNNTYIIRGTKTQNSHKQYIIEGNSYNIKAISERSTEYLKNKINHPHMIFNNNQEFCDYIFKEINLGDFLEFTHPKSFRCIFHEDNNNSAGIFQSENGDWMYHCFGCGVSYNFLGVIERLGNFKSRPKAYQFIREIFNLEIQESNWQKEQKEILIENMKVINSGELEKNCPQAYKNIKNNIKYINQLILIAMDNVHNEKLTDNNDNVLFFASNSFLAKQLNMKPDSSKEISKKNALLAYHKLINKVDNPDINKDMLNRSKAIGANSDNKYKHVNYYSIPSYNTNLFSEIEEQGQKWKDNNYTVKGLSREMFYRTEGEEVANWLYPQYKEVYDKETQKIVKRTTNKKSNKRTDKMVEIIMYYIEKQKYCIEKDIIDNLVTDEQMKIGRNEAERQLKKSLKEILDSYGLKRIRAIKQIKEQFGITSNGYPFILVKKS